MNLGRAKLKFDSATVGVGFRFIRLWGVGLMVWGISGLGFRVQGLGFRA